MTDDYDEDEVPYGEQDFADQQQDIGFKRGFDLGIKTMMRATSTQEGYADYYKRVRRWRFEPWISVECSLPPPMPWHDDETQ